jgi:hypothetical protein
MKAMLVSLSQGWRCQFNDYGTGQIVLRPKPEIGKELLFCPKRPNLLWNPHSHLFSGKQGSFLGIKRPELEVNHSPPSSAKFSNKWIHILISIHAFVVQQGTLHIFTSWFNKR